MNNLKGARLGFINFKEALLIEADLSKCEFFLCSLNNADLTGAKLNNGSFSGCDFYNSNLSKTNFSKSNLSSACIVDAKMVDADVSDTTLDYTEFINTDLSRANFSNASMFNTDFRGSNLTNANFRNATMLYVDLSDTILDGADFTDAEIEIEDTEIQKWLGPENLSKVKISSHMSDDYRKLNFSFESQRFCELISDVPVNSLPKSGFKNRKHTVIVKTVIKEYSVWYSVVVMDGDVAIIDISSLYDYSKEKYTVLTMPKRKVVLSTLEYDSCGNRLPFWNVSIFFDKSGLPSRVRFHHVDEGIVSEFI